MSRKLPAKPALPPTGPSPERREVLPYASPGTEPALELELSPNQRLRRIVVVVAAMSLWFVATYGMQISWGDGFDTGVLFALPLALIPLLRRAITRWLDGLRTPPPRAQLAIALALTAGAALLAYGQAIRADRELMPQWHDEHSYLLQAVHLAQGRLWYPPHPMADFFESFHILVKPVYASIYWPGTGLMNAPGQWLGLPPAGMPLILYGITVGLVYLITARAVDGVAGILAALMAANVFEYDDFTTRIMSQVPMALLGAALIWAWLCWRDAPTPRRRLAWVAAMGVLAGWGAITRPADAMVFAFPVAISAISQLVLERRARTESAGPFGWSRLLACLGATAVVGIGCTLPFLALQAGFNKGVTGSFTRAPYLLYLEQSQPGTLFGASTLDAPPVSTLVQKHEYYASWLRPMQAEFEESWLGNQLGTRLPALLRVGLPGKTFYALFAAGALVVVGAYGAIPSAARRPLGPLVLLLSIPLLFLLIYSANPFFLAHYALPVAVAMCPLAALGLRAVEEATGGKLRPFLVTLLTLGTVGWFGVMAYNAPFGRLDFDHEVGFKYHEGDAAIGQGRALVLVTYVPGNNPHWEPVYNSLTTTPDDARVVWAHDLGPRNSEILDYYARHQPDRQVFQMVRPFFAIYPVGPVGRAKALFDAGQWPEPPVPRPIDPPE